MASSSGSGSGETRLKSYKNKGLTLEEARKKREEKGIQLRRSKRLEQLSKRQNPDAEPDPSDDSGQRIEAMPDPTPNPCNPDIVEAGSTTFNFPQDTSLETLHTALYSADTREQLAAAQTFKKILSQRTPPIQEVIELGCLPKLVEMLSCTTSPFVQLEVALVLTNISAGNSFQTRAVIEAGGVPPLIQLLTSEHDYIREQAIWVLGNLAADRENLDIILSLGAMPPMMALLQDLAINQSTLTWALFNLSMGRRPPPSLRKMFRARGNQRRAGRERILHGGSGDSSSGSNRGSAQERREVDTVTQESNLQTDS